MKIWHSELLLHSPSVPDIQSVERWWKEETVIMLTWQSLNQAVQCPKLYRTSHEPTSETQRGSQHPGSPLHQFSPCPADTGHSRESGAECGPSNLKFWCIKGPWCLNYSGSKFTLNYDLMAESNAFISNYHLEKTNNDRTCSFWTVYIPSRIM